MSGLDNTRGGKHVAGIGGRCSVGVRPRCHRDGSLGSGAGQHAEIVGAALAKNPATTVPQTPLPNVTYAVGGVTIMASGTAIGAIGVSGAPGGQFDEECARAALAKIQERMK